MALRNTFFAVPQEVRPIQCFESTDTEELVYFPKEMVKPFSMNRTLNEQLAINHV